MKSVEDTIRDRIRGQFAEFLSDEDLRNTVQREVKWFTTDQAYWATQEWVSPIRMLVRKILEQKFKDRIRAELEHPDYAEVFKGTDGPAPSPIVMRIIQDSGMIIVKSALERIVQDAINHLKDRSW